MDVNMPYLDGLTLAWFFDPPVPISTGGAHVHR
jgi:hypothetical protein